MPRSKPKPNAIAAQVFSRVWEERLLFEDHDPRRRLYALVYVDFIIHFHEDGTWKLLQKEKPVELRRNPSYWKKLKAVAEKVTEKVQSR